jgi:thiol-disulfide isomerase/thioredoxin
VDYARQHSSHPAPTLIDFLLIYAEADLASDLRAAAQQRYPVRYLPYDWTVNAPGSEPAAPAPSDTVAQLGVGSPMPDLALKLLDGRDWRPSHERGRVLLIDFWASYCRPCLVSFPRYDALQRAHRKNGLTVVAVAEDDSREPVDAFVAARKLSFTVALDAEHLANEPPLNVETLPTVLVVDRQGVIRYRHEGLSEQGVEAVQRQVKRLLGPSAAAPPPPPPVPTAAAPTADPDAPAPAPAAAPSAPAPAPPAASETPAPAPSP